MGEQNTTCSLNRGVPACYRWVTVRPYHGRQIWQLWGCQAQINDAEDPPCGSRRISTRQAGKGLPRPRGRRDAGLSKASLEQRALVRIIQRVAGSHQSEVIVRNHEAGTQWEP
jgi:hypothetical protein